MIKEDIKLALDYLKNSSAPYSNFNVAAVLTDVDDKKYVGVNVETISLTSNVCAERNAIFTAITEGSNKFKRVVVVGGKNGKVTDFTPPCGVCRQALRDYCDPETFEVVIAIDENIAPMIALSVSVFWMISNITNLPPILCFF